MPTPPTPPRRGRPPVDAAAVQLATLELFARRGFSATTVDDIVAELGIGRSTFFRHFPTKSSVLWREHRESSRRLAQELAAAEPGGSLAAVARAIVLSQSVQSADRRLVRLRDRLIASEPELSRESASATAGWAHEVAEHLRTHGWGDPHPTAPEAIAFAFLGAAAAGLRIWSESSDADLAEVLEAALEPITSAMQAAFRPGAQAAKA